MLYSAKEHIEGELCSVIMPAYNSEKYIDEAIESVIRQTYKNWELIIVNDASTDDTEKIIKSYQEKDKRIKLISLSENQGVANARNTAVKNSIGRYIAFLDSDDYWEEEKLQEQIKFMKNRKIAFSYHDYKLLNTVNNKEKLIKVPLKLNYNELLKGNTTGSCLTVCIDRKIVDKIYFPKEKHEDYICWLNILKKYYIEGYGLNKILGTYRIGKKSISSNKLQSAVWNWQVYRKNQNISVLKTIYYMSFYIVNGLKKYL